MNTPIQQNSGPLIQDDDVISLTDILDNFFYYKWFFVVTASVVTLLAGAYALVATPIYQADALIQVEDKKSGSLLGALDQINALGGMGVSSALAEIEILKSRSVVGTAIERLGANVRIRVANRLPLIGDWLSRTLPKDEDGLTKGLWQSEHFAWGGEELRLSTIRVPEDLYRQPLKLRIFADRAWTLENEDGDQLAKGQGFGTMVSGMDGKLQIDIQAFRARPGTVFQIVVNSLQAEISNTLGSFKVIETKRQSNVLDLTFESPSPVYASRMLNAISDAYLLQNVNRRSAEAQKTLKFLEGELPRLQASLEDAETKLNEFRSKTRTVDMSFEFQELLKRSTEIETKSLELDLRRREMALRFDPSHPMLKAVIVQLNTLQSEQAALSRKISELPSVQQDYIRLARNVEVNRELYVNLLNNAQQLQIAKAGTIGNVVIIDRADVPEFPIKPKKAMVVALGLVAGCFLGFLLTKVVAMVMRLVRDPKKLEQFTSIPMLAILPMEIEQEIGQAEAPGGFLLAKERSQSATTEAFRSLRTALIFALSEKPRSKVVLITSAIPGQGKSFISANLAYLFAASGKRVLLIEADIRKPAVLNYLNYDKTKGGLSDLLRSDASAQQVIQKSDHENLEILPAGTIVRNPGELFIAENLKRILSPIFDQYDYVFIDSPPLLPVHDSRTLGNISDVSLFVARQDKVSHAEVSEAIDVFGKSGNKFDGLVFNGFIPSRIRYGYGYGYGYRRYKKYGKYGSGYGYGKKYGSYGTFSRYGTYSSQHSDDKKSRS